MYDRYWGLERRPFAKTVDGEQFEASPPHAEALARLEFLRESRLPLALIIGPSGCGKTAVLREFSSRAERAGCAAIFVKVTAADEQAILAQLADGLCLADANGTWQTWRLIAERFAELRLEGRSGVVLFDDLDRAGPGALSVVERLLGLLDAPLTMVGAARPETAARIGTSILNHAALRIDLALWDEAETAEFLQRSLARRQGQQPIFDAAGAAQLFALSGGVPRKVRQLAELALVAGASQELAQIDQQTVSAVYDELSLVR